jgi:hypothetical protein
VTQVTQIRKDFGFAGGWTVNDQNDRLRTSRHAADIRLFESCNKPADGANAKVLIDVRLCLV